MRQAGLAGEFDGAEASEDSQEKAGTPHAVEHAKRAAIGVAAVLAVALVGGGVAYAVINAPQVDGPVPASKAQVSAKTKAVEEESEISVTVEAGWREAALTRVKVSSSEPTGGRPCLRDRDRRAGGPFGSRQCRERAAAGGSLQRGSGSFSRSSVAENGGAEARGSSRRHRIRIRSSRSPRSGGSSPGGARTTTTRTTSTTAPIAVSISLTQI